jgi:hypothetical protein
MAAWRIFMRIYYILLIYCIFISMVLILPSCGMQHKDNQTIISPSASTQYATATPSITIPAAIPVTPTSNPPTTIVSITPASTINQIPIQTHEEAPVIITKKSNGQVVHVNLVKLVGSVSSPDTQVLINNNPAIVDKDKNYSMLLDLAKGQNIIDIKTIQGTDKIDEKITVTFRPPVAIVMDSPQFRVSRDFSNPPLTVTGKVNDPEAAVTVFEPNNNTTKASVVSDGSFSAQLHPFNLAPNQGVGISTVAILDNEIATDFITFGPGSGGGPRDTRIDILPHEPIKIASGGIALLDYNINARSVGTQTYSVFPSAKIKFDFTRVANRDVHYGDGGIYDGQTLSPVSGLNLEAITSELIIYPNINYHINISVTSSANVAPGTYYYGVISHFNIQGHPRIRVNVVAITVEPR